MDPGIAHYLRLADLLEGSEAEPEGCPVTIEQLSDFLYCTPRNVKFILRKMEERGLIAWRPGRGRGNRSRLQLLKSREDVLEGSLDQLLAKGRMKEAAELIGQITEEVHLRERLWRRLSSEMGFRSEANVSAEQDVLRMMRNRRLEKLEPGFLFTAFEAYLLSQICSTLVVYNGQRNGFEPGLAHTWESAEDDRIWTFYLRKGVKFHHGRTFFARDVAFTIERLRDMGSPAFCHYEDIEEIREEGDYTVSFRLRRPNRFFLHLVACFHLVIVPHDADFARKPVGTGPFRIAHLDEDILSLTAFDTYYGMRPLLDRVDIWFLPDQHTHTRFYNLPGDEEKADAGDLLADGLYGSSVDYPALGCRYLLFNMRREDIQRSRELREAIALLYHPQGLIRELGGNRYLPAASFLPWKSRAFVLPEESPERVRELLRLAGYRGEPVSVGFKNKQSELEEIAWLKRRSEAVGLRLEPVPLPAHLPEEAILETDMLLSEEVLEDDWQWGLLNFYRGGGNHFSLLIDDEGSGLLEELFRDFCQKEEGARIAVLDAAEELARENRWLAYGCHVNKKAQLSDGLLGLSPGAFGFMDLSKLWVKRSSSRT
ncbi:hypothetical protein F4V43_06360 [Paenibacillus spiritus]|uniref:SgrR family transcriptional regulator n=1 Tax=Paenibacillus spiritus TaxID=2496557 RepID=A0A5J5GFM4_9BACL|nr:ABC transporter substrate-binding protein [Paenibacillus spiritus]KAA9006562.1 hypothetical protein F4V43_06360 [Paenibacillus spiritus]